MTKDQLQRAHDKFGELAKQYSSNFPDGFKSNAPTHVKAYLGDAIGPNWPRNPVTEAIIKRAAKDGVSCAR